MSTYSKPQGMFTIGVTAGLAWELPSRNTVLYGKPAEVYHRRSRRELYRKVELMLRTWVRKVDKDKEGREDRFHFSFRVNLPTTARRSLQKKKRKWRDLFRNNAGMRVEIICDEEKYELLLQRLRHISPFRQGNRISRDFTSRLTLFRSSLLIRFLLRLLKGDPDGKMVIPLNVNEGWDLSMRFLFQRLVGQVRCFARGKIDARSLLESCLLIYVAENAASVSQSVTSLV